MSLLYFSGCLCQEDDEEKKFEDVLSAANRAEEQNKHTMYYLAMLSERLSMDQENKLGRIAQVMFWSAV